MKWKIEELKYEIVNSKKKSKSEFKTYNILKINFVPKNLPLEYFLTGIRICEYPNFLKAFNEQTEFYSPPGSLRFYTQLDWEDREDLLEDVGLVGEEDTVIYHEMAGETVLNKNIVGEIVLDYSNHIIKYIEKIYPDFCDEWKREFKRELITLAKKQE
jgi:hypothetical protein